MFYKNKKVLVTGAAGFVGTHFVEQLLEQGANVRATVHNRPIIIDDQAIEKITADLTDIEDCRAACEGVEYVCHAAGAVSAAAVTRNSPMEPIIANLILTARVLQAAWDCKVKRVLIYSSSTGYPAAEYPIKEDQMFSDEPADVYFGYGWMRRYLELLGRFVAQKTDTEIVIVRPTATYGRHDDFDPKTSHAMPALIRRAVEKENPYIVWGTGDEVRDFLHVTDMVRGSLLMLQKAANCDPINIGYGKVVTIKEIVNIILNAADHKNADIQFDNTKPTTIPFRMVDTQKAKQLLNFEPQISLEDGIKDTIQWYKTVQNKKQLQTA